MSQRGSLAPSLRQRVLCACAAHGKIHQACSTIAGSLSAASPVRSIVRQRHSPSARVVAL